MGGNQHQTAAAAKKRWRGGVSISKRRSVASWRDVLVANGSSMAK